MSEKYDEFSDEFLPDEQELRKKIQKLNRELKKALKDGEKRLKVADKIHIARTTNRQMLHDKEIAALRDQIRLLIEKNMELGDACKVFAKGIEHLKREGVRVTACLNWTRKGSKPLELTIKNLTMGSSTRIMSVVPMKVNQYGETIEAEIIYEYIDKYKKS